MKLRTKIEDEESQGFAEICIICEICSILKVFFKYLSSFFTNCEEFCESPGKDTLEG